MNMDDETAKPALVRIAEHFQRHGVEFVVIGGQAAALLGSPIPTYDVDLCYRRDAANLKRLAKALEQLQPTLRGAPPDLSFRLDAESLALGSNFTFNTNLGPLDLLGWVEPLGTYEDLTGRCERVEIGGATVLVIGLADLIEIKRHLARPKDRAALVQLEAIERLRKSESDDR